MAGQNPTRVDFIAELRALVAAVVFGLFLLDMPWRRSIAHIVDAALFNLMVTVCLAGAAQVLFRLSEWRHPSGRLWPVRSASER